MKIYFVRHGQSKHNKEGRITGQIDTPLTEEGLQEAQATAQELPTDLDLIYSSDLARCKQTAEILNEKFNLPIIYDSKLRERNFGSWEGKEWTEMDIAMRAKDHNQEYDYRPFGGESVEDVKNRLMISISDIREKSKGKKVLIVTHGGIIRVLHKLLHGKVPEKIHNASVHEFEFK